MSGLEEGVEKSEKVHFTMGIVTDNSDPDGLGRVKVKYAWSVDGVETSWARVCTFMVGEGFGAMFLPEVGDEVFIAFMNGDIERPVVIGSLWNQSETPPYKNENGKNDLRTLKSRSGHEILFDDGENGGKLSMKSAGGHTILLDDTSGSEKVTVEDRSGNTIKLDSASNKITLKSSVQISIESNMIDIKADGVLTLQGSLIKLN